MIFFLTYNYLIFNNSYLDKQDIQKWLFILGISNYILLQAIFNFNLLFLGLFIIVDVSYTYKKYKQTLLNYNTIELQQKINNKKKIPLNLANLYYKNYNYKNVEFNTPQNSKNDFNIIVPTIDYTLKHTLENILIN